MLVRDWTPLEEAASYYSDFHKDTYGFRPRHTANWTLEDYERETEALRPIYAAVVEREKQAEAAAIVETEATITKLISLGAADRDAAIRWLAEGADVGGDLEFLCYELGVPYGYFGHRRMREPLSYEESWEELEAAAY
jgi:hypothetical protein